MTIGTSPFAGLVWWLARALVRVFYRVERIGGDVPDGPVLLVANHSNGLLDPAVVVTAARRRPRFLAKSTLFTMPVVGWFVKAAGSIPVYRRIDAGAGRSRTGTATAGGGRPPASAQLRRGSPPDERQAARDQPARAPAGEEADSRNEEMFRAVNDALAEGAVVCLFPEGISHSSGRLEPLKTGAARIAFASARSGVRVGIVPVALNFERKEVFRSTVLIGFGPLLSCDAWLDAHAADPIRAVRGLTDEIARHLRDVMIEVAPQSDAALVEDVERLYAAARGLDQTPAATVERRQAIATGILALRQRDPDRFASLHETLRRYERRRERFHLTDAALGASASRSAVAVFAVREAAWAIVLWPVIAIGVAVFFLPYRLVGLLARAVPVTLDQQATVKVVTGVFVYLSWWLVLIAAGWAFGGRPLAIAAAVATPALALATLFAQEREGAVLDVVRGYLSARTMRAATRNRLIAQRAALVALLDETYEWLRRAERDAPP